MAEMTLEQKKAVALAKARLRVQKTDAIPSGRGNWLSDIAAEVVNPNVAPLATVAGIGGALGGPAGAAVGAGGLLASDIAVGGVVNPLLQAFGQQPMMTPSEAINALYGPNIVAPEATTSGRRAARTVGAFVAPTRGTIGAVSELAPLVTSPTTRNVLSELAAGPTAQTVAAAGGGTAVAAGQEAGVTDPLALAALGLVGGAAPTVATIPIKAGVRGLYNVTEPFLPGGADKVKARAYLEAFDNDPNKVQQAINLLEMGTPPEKVATAMNASGFAALLGSARNASTIVKDLYLARDAALQQGQANKLAVASQSINAMRTSLDNEQAARAAALAQQDEVASRAVQTERERLAGRLPRVSQRDVGRTVTERRASELDRVQQTVVRPAYATAFSAAPDPFTFEGVEAAARELAKDTGTALNPQQAPYTSDVIRLYKAKPVTKAETWGGETIEVPTGEVSPAMVTLEEADTFIRALNQDLAALSGNMDASANVTRRNLMKLKTAAEEAIEAGTEGTEAAKLYKKARDAHREQVVERFRTGWVANLEREGATGVQILAPESVVKTVLTNEDNAIRLLSALGEDRLAMDAVRNGIVDRYRREVVRDGVIVPAKSADFFRKYEDALRTLDDAGLKLTDQLRAFDESAARLTEAGEAAATRAAAEFEPRARELKELERRVKSAVSRVDVPPQESQVKLQKLIGSSDDVARVVEQVRRDLRDKRRFERLVREGIQAGGGVKGLASEQAGPRLQVFDQLFTFANFVLARAQGRVDAKLAVDIAKEMLNSDPAAKALARAMVEGKRSKFGEALQRPAARPGRGAVINVLAPVVTQQNQLGQ